MAGLTLHLLPPTRDQNADNGIANRITHKGEEKKAPQKWEQAVT